LWRLLFFQVGGAITFGEARYLPTRIPRRVLWVAGKSLLHTAHCVGTPDLI
jgi:hypothetical protein